VSLKRIIHTADCHGTQGVYERIRGLIDSETLFLDAGDSIVGSNTAFRWSEPNLTLLSELGCQAMTMGNRELHYVPWILERRASERNFPLLASNLVELWGRQKTWQEGVSLNFEGLRVGVFGMTVVQYPVGSPYEKIFGLRFLPPETLIEHLVETYQKEHDLVIFLSHLGLDSDRRLARQLLDRPDLKCDFILGGHTHNEMKEPETYGATRLSHIGSHSTGYGLWEERDGQWEFQLQRETVSE